jgi:hypothetical protein
VNPELPASDDDREVDLSGDDDQPVLATQTRDDTDHGWGERTDSNDQRLLEDRPPHWG